MLVNAKGAVESRPVETSGVQGQNWIVTNGLKAGDKVIVDGVAKVKEGQEVSAKPPSSTSESTRCSSNATKQAQSGKPQAEQKASNA